MADYADAELSRMSEALQNAHTAGDVVAAGMIATELRRKMERQGFGLPDPIKVGQESMPAAIKATVPEFGAASQRLVGAAAAPMLAGHGIAELAGANNGADIQNWKALRDATPDTVGGNLVGTAAAFGAAPTRAVSPLVTALGAKALPRWAQILDTGGTMGAVGAATTPGDAVERATSGGMGMLGAAAPGAVGAGQTGRRVLTKEGSRLSLAESLRRELGPETDVLANQLQGAYPTSRLGVNPSAAMLTRNPTLEVLETGSRTRTGDQWANFDRMNATARWEALQNAAGTPEELKRLKDARDLFTTPLREDALHFAQYPARGGFSAQVLGDDIAPLKQKLAALASGDARPNPAVQTMVSYVGRELEKDVTPAQLYTIRKSLTDGIANAPTSELSQAARAARPERMELIKLIDQTLDDLSQGGWKTYLEKYKISSPMISSKSALHKITDSLTSGRPAGEIPDSLGVKPAPFTFGKLNERYGTKQFGSQEFDQLIPQHRQLVDSLLSDLKSQSDVMLPRATLGSPTAPFTANAGRVNQLTSGAIDAAGAAVPLVGGPLAAAAKGSLNRKNEEALAELLQNPKRLAEALKKAKAAQDLLNASGRVGAGGGADIRSMRD